MTRCVHWAVYIFPPPSCAAPCDILYIGTGDMSIFVQIEDSRRPYLIREPLCCVCSSGRGRGNLSYFAGDRSQSSPRNADNEKSDPALFFFLLSFFFPISQSRFMKRWDQRCNRCSSSGCSSTLWQYNSFARDFELLHKSRIWPLTCASAPCLCFSC